MDITMEHFSYYHVCADGSDARNFITSEEDKYVAFNLVGVCAFYSGATVVAFSIEDTHPHFLLFGSYEDCLKFKTKYEYSYKRYVSSSRGSIEGMKLEICMYEIKDESHLMNVGTYVINQATKDGKKVMPYDYLLGTGSMYFRPKSHRPIWCYNSDGEYVEPSLFGDLTIREKAALLHIKPDIPLSWLICNGYLLPQNYVDVMRFESIYRSHNCFRTFLSSGKSKETPIIQKLAEVRGIMIEDFEARRICSQIIWEKFKMRDVRKLTPKQRIEIALELRNRYGLNRRQISIVVHLPLSELEKYLR